MTPRRLVALLVVLLGWFALMSTWARRTRVQHVTPASPPRQAECVTTDDGVDLHVELDGKPDADITVVFVHGLLARSGEWDNQWEALRGRTRLVRYDHRGHGRSARPHGAAHVDRLGRDLGQVLDGVTEGPVVLVGHSMGGMSVLALAVQRPELFGDRVRGVALLATGAGHDIEGHPVENAVRWLARRHVLSPLLWLLRALAPSLERVRPRGTRLLHRATRAVVFGQDDVTTPALVSQVQRMLEEPPLATLAQLQGSVLRVDQRAGLPVLRRVPVVVVGGSDDRLTRVEHARAIARDLGEAAELVVLPGAGHVLNRTRPHEVNAAIDRLLARAAV